MSIACIVKTKKANPGKKIHPYMKSKVIIILGKPPAMLGRLPGFDNSGRI
jgi:hypothetical protein